MKTNPLGERKKFWEDFLEKYSQMAVDGVIGSEETVEVEEPEEAAKPEEAEEPVEPVESVESAFPGEPAVPINIVDNHEEL